MTIPTWTFPLLLTVGLYLFQAMVPEQFGRSALRTVCIIAAATAWAFWLLLRLWGAA